MTPASCLTFQGYDLAGRVHDGAVGRDGPADGRVGVCHVDDHHLSLLAHLLTDADELVRLHGQGAEANVGRIDAQVLELRDKREKVESPLADASANGI